MNYSRDPPPPYESAANIHSAPYPNIGFAVGPYSEPAGYQDNSSDQEPKYNRNGNFTSLQYSDKYVRHAFIRKVYLILTAQLLVTSAFVCVFLFSSPVKYWVSRNSWFYYLSYVRRRYPGNVIALSVFTLAFSYMTGTITSFYDTQSVLIAVIITACLCIAISIFAIQTRIDITKCTSLIFVLTIVVMLTGLACVIVFAVSKPNWILQVVYGGLAALLFGVYLAFDTQHIMGGRELELSAEEYIFGALQLYLDVVNLFLIILSFFGNRDS
ncbi:putative recs1 protein (responsive to centrifugal force and shear stressprotein 1 protein) [Schistosoma mansoni]|uniref:putative recs1 protein (responsive to centrifugal force and shear stressprotein 1 protein) n=1 Tax=Schistosoma mansoni TaxID=6183 RepID=UPI00019B366D|nr:putative recs1 protein (responsive to centrifugal force and shear stressprotein 1 protein) [Schistosoma mansoni]|eukprot:XP_018650696.1 putative recs1 protein (responsive to centrifugal force and shear stressprotein 1 protein) [Schistosoma mansoni]